MKYFVYQLRDPRESEPFYIGKGTSDRPREHFRPCSLREVSHKTNKIKSVLNSGLEVLIEMVSVGLTEEEALRREVWCIKLWGRRDLGEGPLTNQTDGGDGLFNISEESRKKMSLSHTGKKLTEETKRRMTETRRTDEQRRLAADRKSKHYKFLSPEGEEIDIFNLHQFCLEAGLNQSAMSKVYRGIHSQHKGWKKVV